MNRFGILNKLHNTGELRTMPYPVLEELCDEIRKFLVENVSKTGGHLASNLGIVELSVALERVFDTKRDRVIYDVGHQSYVHKILTGRKDRFESLRTYGGLSGFMKPEESETDPCITGHASSSVSVALGMAHARSLRGHKYHVVSVIGDGALTGGMAYEALNSAGGSAEPLIVVLNDNNMSISQNVGALNRHLAKLRVSPRYQRAKTRVKNALAYIPGGGNVTGGISKLKSSMKNVVLPTTLFEQMGFAYLGPVNGHDLKEVCELLTRAKSMKKPVLLHVITQKGKGYTYAERSPDKFHGVSAFNAKTGIPLKAKQADFSACFGNTLCAMAARDERICAVTAAMPSGTGLTNFSVQYPRRFFDVGIAEEHAVAMAAGMAKQGLKPICALYSTFLQRAFDQLIHDVAIEGLDLVLAVDRAGVVGEDGETHNGVFDIGFLRQIPGMQVLAPASFEELSAMLSHAVYKTKGPVAVRYPRGGEGNYKECNISMGAVRVRDGADLVLVSYGIMINEALDAADALAQAGIEAAVYKINALHQPFTAQMLADISACGKAVIIEDTVHQGSIGQALAALLGAQPANLRYILPLNIGDRFLPCGSVRQLYHDCGIDREGIVKAVLEAENIEQETSGCPAV